MTVRLLWRTDVHLSDHTPQSRKDSWTSTVLGKIAQVGKLAWSLDVDAVMDGGDFFDIKSPTRNSHRLVQAAARIHNEFYHCPVYANVGNHDCKFGDRRYLPEQPLGVLFETGVFEPLYDEHEAFFESESVTVRVVGIPYHGPRYDLSLFQDIKKGTEDYLIVIAHVLASPGGGTMFESEDIIKYSDLTSLNPDVSCWFFGHWHKDQGIKEIAPDRYVVNVGSLTRGSLAQDNLDRKPCAVLLECSAEGLTLTRHNLLVDSSDKVFDIEGKRRAEDREDIMEQFVASIKSTLQADSNRTLEDVVGEMDHVSNTVRERVLHYIEQARS